MLSNGRVNVKLSLCLTTYTPLRRIHCLIKYHAMKAYWRSGCKDPRILNHSTRWRWVVSFMPWPLYTGGKSPQYPLNIRLGGLRRRSGCDGEVKKIPSSPPSRTESWSSSQQLILAELSQL